MAPVDVVSTGSEAIAMGVAVQRAGADEPDRPSVSLGDRTLTWAEVDAWSERLASALVARGVQPHDSVAVVLPNGLSFMVAAAATWKAGATPVLLSPRMPPTELRELLELCEPRIVITRDPGHGPRSQSSINPEPFDLGEGQVPGEAVPPGLAARRWAAFGSGGSTGRPKVVFREQPAVLGGNLDFDSMGQGYGLDRDTVILLPGPLCHAGPFGLATFTFLSRGHIVMLDRFDAEETLAAIERHRATTVFLVPTMMHRIMQLAPAVRDGFDLASLRTVWHAAAPCSVWLKEAWIEWLGPERIMESYGASDSAGMTRITGAEWLEHRGSVGRPSFGGVAILGDDGQPLPTGQVGDIYMRAPQGDLLRTYVGAAAPEAVDGWWTVGDMGWLDDDGYLYLADRRVDLIITGGLNVYPAEVEGALEAHPLVVSSVVVGVPDDDLGKRVHAVVHTSAPVDADELRAFVRERLSPYKVPKTIELSGTPLRDDAGKVRRSAIAARAAGG